LLTPSRGGPAAVGTWIKSSAVESVEIMAQVGFDFIVIDMEHTMLGLAEVYRHIITATSCGLPPLVRVPDHASATIQRVLDAGARGVLVPHVDTADQARAAAAATRFPPHGTRGAGNTSRAGRWGQLGRAEYLRYGNAETLCIPQLESRTAITNAAAILGTPGIDAALVGPADLALDADLPAGSADFSQLTEYALHAARDAGKPLGTVTGSSPPAAQDSYRRGYSFVIMSNDLTMLAEAAASLMERFRQPEQG